jgi:sugar phosphate isomerase/epimerase
MDSKIALTLFSLRNHCKTESDFANTLDKLYEIGYRQVQVSGVPLEFDIIRKHLDEHQIKCIGTHESFEMMQDTSKLVDKLQTLGCNFAALGCMPLQYQHGENFEEFVNIVNSSCTKLTEHGIQFAYHNHHFELAKMANKKTLLENLYEQTERGKLLAEIDVHWITRGGGSPATWIRKYTNRIPVIHFKDFVHFDTKPTFCEIGEGNLDWHEILKACDEANVEIYVVEQDEPYGNRDIFESVKISFDNMKAMGIK